MFMNVLIFFPHFNSKIREGGSLKKKDIVDLVDVGANPRSSHNFRCHNFNKSGIL